VHLIFIKTADFMLNNLFGSHVPSDLSFLEHANKKYFDSLAAYQFNLQKPD
jgi:hypothetical protein